MKRIQGSRSAICNRSELRFINELFGYARQIYCYELPLFELNPKIKQPEEVEGEYVLIRCSTNKISESFFNRINQTWNKIIENGSKH